MGCARQIPLPILFLKNNSKIIQDYGGICISNKNQGGFGRIGKHF